MKCIRAHELSYAFAISQAYEFQSSELLYMLACRGLKYANWDLALGLVQHDEELKELFATVVPEDQAPPLRARYQVQSPDGHSQAIEGSRNFRERLLHLIGARQFSQAAEAVVYETKRRIEAGIDMHELFELPTFTRFIDLTSVPISLKAELLALSALLGGVQSYWKGYSITHCLLGTCFSLVNHQNLALPVPQAMLLLVPALLELYGDVETGQAKVNSVIEQLSVAERESVQALLNEASAHTVGKANPAQNMLRLIGTNLPSNNLQAMNPVSIFSRKVIGGSAYVLQAKIAISMEEAVMWARVNPFSPLNDGSTINPF